MRLALALAVLAVALVARPVSARACEVAIEDPDARREVQRYDVRGRLVEARRTTDDGSITERFRYDRAGRLVAIDSVRESTRHFNPHEGGGSERSDSRWRQALSYDRAGRLREIVVRHESWRFDSGRRQRDGAGQYRETRHYDTAGRLVRIEHEDGKAITHLTYDAQGRLLERTLVGANDAYRVRITRDPAGRPSRAANDICSRDLSRCTPGRTAQLGFDAQGRLTSFVDSVSHEVWTYGADGLVADSFTGGGRAHQDTHVRGPGGRLLSVERRVGADRYMTTVTYGARCGGVALPDALAARSSITMYLKSLTLDCVQSAMGTWEGCRSLDP